MSEKDSERIKRRLLGYSAYLPGGLDRAVAHLLSPQGRRWRLPAGILLIACGMVGFLPILGFWMVPLGILLLAMDVPQLRRPTLRTLVWFDRKGRSWRNRSRAGNGDGQ